MTTTLKDTPLTASKPLVSWRVRLQQAVVFLLIMGLALWARLNFAPANAFPPDLRSFAEWMQIIQVQGLLHFYDAEFHPDVTDRLYPPLATVSLGAVAASESMADANLRWLLEQPEFVARLKILPIACELVLIAVVYFWLMPHVLIQRVITVLLALHPAMVVLSGWWGQTEPTFVVFLVLALISLNRRRPLWAWGWFAVALLMKQPAAVLAPVLLVVTLRRHGWRKTLWGIVLCGGLCLVAFAPFIVTSGFENALSPYLRAGGAFPYLTNNAYNTWYAAASAALNNPVVRFSDPAILDDQMLIGPVSYKLAALAAFGGYVLMLMGVMWRQANRPREFVWAAALYFAFFMLPTEVHERYLYAAAVFLVIAIAQDRRVWWIALGVLLTLTYNLMAVLDDGLMRTLQLEIATEAVPCAILNGILFAALTGYVLFYPRERPEAVEYLPLSAE